MKQLGFLLDVLFDTEVLMLTASSVRRACLLYFTTRPPLNIIVDDSTPQDELDFRVDKLILRSRTWMVRMILCPFR